MEFLTVERLGGLAGFGGPGAAIRSRGRLRSADLGQAERAQVEALFTSRGASASEIADGFRYRISRATAAGTETIEVAESVVPAVVIACVRDELP